MVLSRYLIWTTSLTFTANVEVLLQSFDQTGLEDQSVDVVVSNGAINLTSCKESVFAEIHRMLKDDGKLQFADMVDVSVDEGACCSVENSSCCDESEGDWANCVAGTLRVEELVEIIQKAGFKDVVCSGLNHYKTASTTQGATFSATKISSKELRRAHWDGVFKTSDYSQVLWHQSSPKKSLDFIRSFAPKEASIIDAGCGASLLVDALLEDGYENVTLLDASQTSLDLVNARIPNQSVRYVCDDVLNYKTDKKFDIWHDRAVFHFLTTKKERDAYFEVLTNVLKENATAIISTFRVDGPIACAGLDVVQYDETKMLSSLPSGLRLLKSEEFTHVTPKNSEQKYIYFIMKKEGNETL